MTQFNTNGNTGFQTPAEPAMDTIGLQGSMQQILQDNIGNYVSVEFLIGTQTMVTRQGLLYSVGAGFLVLYDDVQQVYEVCDVFSVKFVTFYLPGYRPGQISQEDGSNATGGSSASRPSQAALAYVQARGRK